MLKIRLFDEEHEEDLEGAVNAFLENIPESHIKDVKYQVSISDSLRSEEEPTIYSYSIMVVYSE
ncbi:sporulation protein Cse60 [Fictibacillus fluitans]|uniref:Sporulation protein Cse60 n=1 Tax=Fictibacillus fluitans TaxID=3058422 RepID=A0ABT8I0Q4_9BACL|nr:sporulation protein Cse60 [Fictibacillus sp. NE201]MDN4526549.1 sporulation protein Cse60 [Fictibacillus sp. NE201]